MAAPSFLTRPVSPAVADRLALAGLILILATVLLIPLRIAALGYLPHDDALRHVGHALDSRPWSEVLVLNPAIHPEMDSHPGWHALLRAAHRVLGLGPDGLLTLSYSLTFGLVALAGLVGSRNPLAWLLTLVAAGTLMPEVVSRQFFGRPLSLSVAALVFLLFVHQRTPRLAHWKPMLLGAVVLGLAIWMHPSWYLWLLLVPGIWLTRGTKDTLAFLGSLALALGLASVASGSCYSTVLYPVEHLRLSLGQDLSVGTGLVEEFQPRSLSLAALGLVAFLFGLRRITGTGERDPLLAPDLILAVLGGILGLAVSRFWYDWAAPALLVWACRQTALALAHFRVDALRRGAATAVGCLALFLTLTTDLHERYTTKARDILLTTPEQKLRALLPTGRGILYNASMTAFYDLYWRFPDTTWRYVLGFEPGMMTPEDRATYAAIMYNNGIHETLLPWIRRMTPDDRVLFTTDVPPAIPGMHFDVIYGGIWIGRREPAPAAAP